MRFLFWLAFFTAMLYPQSIVVPRSGVTFDGNSNTFRPVMGVLGAATLGDALELPKELHDASLCAPQQFALAAFGREGVLTLLHLDTLKTSAISPAALNAPSRIQLSAGCSAAAIYSAPANRLQIVTGLPAKRSLAADLTLDLPGAISALAVSDDGQLVVAAVSGRAVYLVPAAGHSISLMSIQQDAAVAMRGNQDAIVADRSANTVTLFANASGTPTISRLANAETGINSPTGVWFDTPTASVVVANSGNGKVNLVPLLGGPSQVIDCRCQLGSLSPLTDRAYELQAPAPNEPLRILDLGTSPPRVVFVATPELPRHPKGQHTSSSDISRN